VATELAPDPDTGMIFFLTLKKAKPVLDIHVESRRKKSTTIEKLYPDCAIVDVTSKGAKPIVQFSPFYPHGKIPIPNTPDIFAQSVEGL